MTASSPYPQRRNDKRYRSKLPVRVRLGGRVLELVAEDMSFRGLFLACHDALPVRQLIQIEASLPPGNLPFAAHAMVVHIIPANHPSGRPAGCGLQFYGMGDKRRVWDEYVRYLQGFAPLVPDDRVALVQDSTRQPPTSATSWPSLSASTSTLATPPTATAGAAVPRPTRGAAPLGRRPVTPPPIPLLAPDDLELLDSD